MKIEIDIDELIKTLSKYATVTVSKITNTATNKQCIICKADMSLVLFKIIGEYAPTKTVYLCSSHAAQFHHYHGHLANVDDMSKFIEENK